MFPDHPDQIILKNKYYPKGLKEIDIWNYYQSIKEQVLKETKDRNVMLILLLDDKFLIRRNWKGEIIHLTSKNYSNMITGRTISIHSEMHQKEDFIIIDVDYHDFEKTKECVREVYEYIVDHLSFINLIEIRYTGKDGFHLHLKLNKTYNIDAIRLITMKELKNSPLSKKYDIGFRRNPDRPNLDFSPDFNRKNFIVLGSLSLIGLKSIIVKYNDLQKFKKEMAIIRP